MLKNNKKKKKLIIKKQHELYEKIYAFAIDKVMKI